MYVLTLALKEGKTRSYPVRRFPCLVGSAQEAQVRIPSSHAAPLQARITVEEGFLWIENLTPGHGVEVNGKKVDREKIQPGDRILIGSLRFGLARAGPAREAAQSGGETEKEPSAPRNPGASQGSAAASRPAASGERPVRGAVAWKANILQYHRKDAAKGRSFFRDDFSQHGGGARLLILLALLILAAALFLLGRWISGLLV